MTRGGRLAGVMGLILGMLAVLGAQNGPLTEPPDTSLLRIPQTGPRRKPPVRFSHRVHADRQVACIRCHHDYRGRRNIWHEGLPVEKCQACHGLRPQARRPELKNAFHRQCKGCHLQVRQSGRPAGPIECRDCHRPAGRSESGASGPAQFWAQGQIGPPSYVDHGGEGGGTRRCEE